jgi:hypothetical protein
MSSLCKRDREEETRRRNENKKASAEDSVKIKLEDYLYMQYRMESSARSEKCRRIIKL